MMPVPALERDLAEVALGCKAIACFDKPDYLPVPSWQLDWLRATVARAPRVCASAWPF